MSRCRSPRDSRRSRVRNLETDQVALAERNVSRRAAVDAVREIPAGEARIELPPAGRISYAHLRRWHPETATAILGELRRAEEAHPAVAEATKRYREAVGRCAELKGLVGDERDRYVREAMSDLDARRANAMLRVLAPDRTRQHDEVRIPTPPPTGGPAARRAAERRMAAEVTACATKRELDAAVAAVRERRPVPDGALRSCPSYRGALLSAPAAGSAALSVLATSASQNDRRDVADEAAETALRILARAALAALRAATAAGGDAARINEKVQKEVRI